MNDPNTIQKLRSNIAIVVFLIMTAVSCIDNDPNTNAVGEDILVSHEVSETVQTKQMNFNQTLYVPIYSDIYLSKSSPNSLLAATLSISNTSFQDSLFVSAIDYYNTGGTLVRKYLDNTIALRPLETIEYVIEREDDSGGSGANFIVKLSAKSSNISPLVQAVMVGSEGNKGFAFTTDGYVIPIDN